MRSKVKRKLHQKMGLFVFLLSSYSSAQAETFYQEQIAPTLRRASDPTSLQLLTLSVPSILIARNQDDSVRSQWMDHQKISVPDAKPGDILGSGAVGLTVAL